MRVMTVRLLALCFAVSLMAAGLAQAQDHGVMVREKAGVGKYLTDGKGMTLYTFAKDTPGKSACTGACLQKWPALAPSTAKPQAGLDAKEFGTLKRDDGTEQVTYAGYPLYYFANDKAPGDTTGQGVNDVWHVVDPAKFPPKN
uniref:Lipoprotein with Yx(FWY)xxD motif n=1 Tax=Desulfovibrio sp. U5L TaxID=596152 RepID=I2PZB4_9BACT